MGKYRIKMDEESLYCIEYSKDKVGLIKYFKKSNWSFHEKLILCMVISAEWLLYICKPRKWKGLEFVDYSTKKTVHSISHTTWYKDDKDIDLIIKIHQETIKNKKNKFENILKEWKC